MEHSNIFQIKEEILYIYMALYRSVKVKEFTNSYFTRSWEGMTDMVASSVHHHINIKDLCHS